MLSLRGEEEPLVLATIRLLLTLTQDGTYCGPCVYIFRQNVLTNESTEHTKGLVRDLTMIELQKLTLAQNAAVQNAAKKIVSLF